MTLVAATGGCDWCTAFRDPLPVLDGDLAYCSLECRDWHRSLLAAWTPGESNPADGPLPARCAPALDVPVSSGCARSCRPRRS